LRTPLAPTLALFVTLGTVGVSAVVFSVVIPGLIVRAYQGEAGVLNALIRGQAIHSLEHYLLAWHRMFPALLILEAAVGATIAGILWSTPALSRMTGLRPTRVMTVQCVTFLLVGMQVIEMGLQLEHWPFSNYPMYSGIQPTRLSWVRVAGIVHGSEFWLSDSQIRPFAHDRISHALNRHVSSGPNWQARADDALAGILRLYEAGRQTGRHAGPPLLGVRLYRLAWALNPSLANQPARESKELIREYRVR
jgi:hypothetical protein